MPKCPSCDADLDMDFGMVTCKACQAVLMIDISGQVQMASDDSGNFDDNGSEVFANLADENDADSESNNNFQEDDFENSDLVEGTEDPNYLNEDQDWDDTPEASDEVSGDNVSMSETDEINDEEFNPEFAHFNDSSDSEDDQGEDILTDSESDDDEDLDQEDISQEDSLPKKRQPEYFSVEDEEVESFPMAATPDPNPVDITDFANSEESNLEEGELLYDVYLGRIDSRDQKDEVKFVLMDEKLKLNHGEYLKKIRGGKLLIPDLNPIKAKRIVEQLQYSDLDIKWKQKRVIIETLEPDEDFEEEGESGDDEEVDL